MYQPTVFGLLREVMGLPAAPWILRILLYFEGTSPEWNGLTEQEVVETVQRKFTDKLHRTPPLEKQIRSDLSLLRAYQLIDGGPPEMIRLSERGRDIAKELTPAVTTV